MKRLVAILAFILVLLTAPAWSQTRFYLPYTGTQPVAVAFSAYWDISVTTQKRNAVKTKIGSTISFQAGAWAAVGDQHSMYSQFISGQLAAYSWTATDEIKVQIRCLFDPDCTSTVLACSIRVVSGDGGTIRGTLFEGDGPTTWSSTYPGLNRSLGAAGAHVHVQNSVSMLDGDRIVIELGGYQIGVPVAGNSSGYWHGDSSASDMPEDETSASTYNPWVEFSPTIADYSAPSTMINNILIIIGRTRIL